MTRSELVDILLNMKDLPVKVFRDNQLVDLCEVTITEGRSIILIEV